MKRILALIFALCLGVGAIAGLSACKGEDLPTVNVYMPDGATALSLAYMMKNAPELAGKKIKYTVVDPTMIADYVRNGSADMAVLPTNAAAALYKQGFEYKYAAAVTHGNLYLIGTEAEDFSDLVGSVVGCIGRGNIPDLIFQYILKGHGIDFVESETPVAGKVAIRYFGNGTLMRNIMAANPDGLKYGVLAAPDVINVLEDLDNVAGVTYGELFNLQHEWLDVWEAEKGYPELVGEPLNGYPQAGLFVKNSLDSEFVDAFLAKSKEGEGWAERNPSDALSAINDNMPGSQSTITYVSGRAAEQIMMCNIKTQTADLKDYVKDFLAALNIAAPSDGFYYQGQ